MKALLLTLALIAPALWARDCFVYFGTYTDGSSKGIYVSRLDMETGKLSTPELAAAIASPNYLAVSPDGRFLYASIQVGKSTNGMVAAFTRDGHTGSLKLLDEKPAGDVEPCYVGLDAAGQNVFIANYPGGSVKSFHLHPDGTLADGTFIQHTGKSINPSRQTAPHAHCFVGAPAGEFALACDLGIDKVMIYKVNAENAALTPNKPPFAPLPPGSGPRHLAFSPDGKTVCVISEMAGTVTVYDWDGVRGTLHPRQVVALLPPGLHQDSFTAAEIAYRPDGQFVYATVRGPHAPGANTISVLAVDAKTGNLSLVQNIPCEGDFPRGMGIDPSGHWLIIGNQKSGTVTAFGIDDTTGKLTYTGQSFDVGSAVDVKFAPAE
ncbi:MAG TPA: lactonase family protein [Pseudomonadales bacterium]|nr:lactonase family protein [Pseudomonadales bacterium]